MTDLPPRDLDQLASDLVDGILPPDEAARLRADPEVATRVARIEALRGALRAVPPAPPGALDRMVARAVAATAEPTPARLQAVRRPAHTTPRPLPRSSSSARSWLVAAAAVVVAGLAFAGLTSLGSSRDEDQATSAGDSGGSAETADPSAGGGSAEEGGGMDTNASDDDAGAAPESADGGADVRQALGSFSDPDALADAVAADQTQGASSLDNELSAAADTCAALMARGDTSRGLSTYVADAEYQGATVRVHVYERDGRRRLVATDQACTDVVDEPFDR